jgi:hypothetical protein
MVEEKGKVLCTFRKGVINFLYFCSCSVLLIFPCWYTAEVVPAAAGFLSELGDEAPMVTRTLLRYSFPVALGCTGISLTFLTWNFFKARPRTSGFQNKIFLWWLGVTNIFFPIWLILGIFSPVYTYMP